MSWQNEIDQFRKEIAITQAIGSVGSMAAICERLLNRLKMLMEENENLRYQIDLLADENATLAIYREDQEVEIYQASMRKMIGLEVVQ